MTQSIFLCAFCFPNPDKEAFTRATMPRGQCSYCGAICSDSPTVGLPPGSLVDAANAPPPRALSRQEREAQVRDWEAFRSLVGEGIASYVEGEAVKVLVPSGAESITLTVPITTPQPEPPNPFIAEKGNECAKKASCGGLCAKPKRHKGGHACAPDPKTGKETCPA